MSFSALIPIRHKPDVHPFPEILHRLTEDRVVHQLEEVALKRGLGNTTEARVQVDIRSEPRTLIKRQHTMNLAELQTVFQIKLEVSVVNHVPALVAQVRDKFAHT